MGDRLVWHSLILAAMLATAPPAPIRVATPHFEMYTTESEALAREAILRFEMVRAFFERHGGALRPPAAQVRVIAFRSPEEYRPYGATGFATAHYQAAPERESIVTSSLASGSYPAAVHEFVHLLIRNTGAKAPLWLSEGTADLYSTIQPLPQGRVRVGEPPAGYLRTLRERPWLDLEALLSAEQDSPVYSDPQFVPLFYAQSWALAHMLALSGSQQRPLPAVSSQPPAELRKQLEAYLKRDQLPSEVLTLDGEVILPKLEVRPVGDLEWGLVLAEQSAGLANNLDAARRAYEDLGKRHPESWEPPAALAYIARGRGNLEEARRLFARAVELKAPNVKLHLDYADLVSDNSRIAVLRRALELRPADVEIQFRLAMALYDAMDFRAAREWLLKVRTVPDEKAPELYRVLAYVNDRLGLEEEARSAARRAVEVARTADESEAARGLLDFITRPPAPVAQVVLPETPEPVAEAPPVIPPAPPRPRKAGPPLYAVQGELVQFDCLGNTARIWVRTREEKLAFRVEYPDGLVIRRGGAPVLRFMNCGPQKAARVTVRYEMRRDTRLSTLGVVRVLEYR